MNNARSQFGRVSRLWLNSSLKDEDVSNNLSGGTITGGIASPIAGGRHRLPEANPAEVVRDGVGAVVMTVEERGEVLAEASSLARLLGREDSVLELDLLHRRGGRAPKTFNPFSYAGADGIRAILESQLMAESHDRNGVFREGAVRILATVAPVLVWLRDHKGIPLDIELIRLSIELRWMWRLAMDRIVLLRDRESGKIHDLDVSDEIPEEIISALKSYLWELPGYDPALPLDRQRGDEPGRQHGFAQFYWTPTFVQLAVSLGHIFRVERGDIDLRDVIREGGILVVNLPALEAPDDTCAALSQALRP